MDAPIFDPAAFRLTAAEAVLAGRAREFGEAVLAPRTTLGKLQLEALRRLAEEQAAATARHPANWVPGPPDGWRSRRRAPRAPRHIRPCPRHRR